MADIVTSLRDHPHTMVDKCECVRCEAADEIERLQRWKVEACSVLADWDALYVGLGDRGELGQRKSAVVAAEMERLRAEIERLRAAGDVLAEALHAWINGMDAFTDDAERVRAWQEVRRG